MNEHHLDELRKIAASTPQVFFRPMAFFVARCGVLTLVFDGFSSAILELKRGVEKLIPNLEPEHEGSTWPKVTLGMLRDHETLSARDIVRLRDIADDWNDTLRNEGEIIALQHLSAVEYGCRSLEKRYQTIELPLKVDELAEKPPQYHAEFVQSIVSQFSREKMDRYAAELEKRGHRETHYRSPARGWSLVADIARDRLPLANAVIDEVERLVPGKYCRIDPDSRHITIRSLDVMRTKRGRAEIDAAPVSGSSKADQLAE
ncbi:MAG: hypothetical protein KJO98_16625 [Rhodothermia bacterium]|nr:hypothetical protein [Rhodothermia bacterium]